MISLKKEMERIIIKEGKKEKEKKKRSRKDVTSHLAHSCTSDSCAKLVSRP